MGRCSSAYQYPLSGVGAACSELARRPCRVCPVVFSRAISRYSGALLATAQARSRLPALRDRKGAQRAPPLARSDSALLRTNNAAVCPSLRYGRRQGSGGAEAGFCARTAAGTPPYSLPARCPSQLRTAARGQGGVGECMARQTPRPTSSPGSLPADWGRPAGLPRSAPAGNQPSSPLGDFLPGPSPSSVPLLLQVLSGCGVYDGTEIHEASA